MAGKRWVKARLDPVFGWIITGAYRTRVGAALALNSSGRVFTRPGLAQRNAEFDESWRRMPYAERRAILAVEMRHAREED